MLRPSKSAFSIAEAIITLLIVSLALAAAAPIMSRQMKNSVTNNYNSLWGKNDNEIYYNKGNVGIGTNNPASKLHISSNGSLRIDNNNDDDLAISLLNGGIRKFEVNSNGSIYTAAGISTGNGSSSFNGPISAHKGLTVKTALNVHSSEKLIFEELGQSLTIISTNASDNTQKVRIGYGSMGADGIHELHSATAWISADGDSTFAPKGMIAPFARSGCPDTWAATDNNTYPLAGKSVIYCKKQ